MIYEKSSTGDFKKYNFYKFSVRVFQGDFDRRLQQQTSKTHLTRRLGSIEQNININTTEVFHTRLHRKKKNTS